MRGPLSTETETPTGDEFDQRRAENYQVLSLLLASPPSSEVLALLSGLTGDTSKLGQAWNELARAAAETDPTAVEREFFNLFVGVGRGELLPYASFYITGFLHERPLAELRGDLALLGIARKPDDHEPEDRIALICAVMASYARGELPGTTEGPGEAEFFARHLAPWAGLFFDDLDVAPAAGFYRAVAGVGREFMLTEQQTFALAAQEKATV